MAEIIVEKEFDGIKIERLLKRLFPHLPLSFIFKILRKGKVRINKKKATNSQRVNEGDTIILHLAPEVLYEGKKEDPARTTYTLSPSDIIMENEDFIAINKPPGLAVHGGEGHREDVLLRAVFKYLGYEESSLRFPPTPVHRLDIDTSGVLIIAKNYDFLRTFNELQQKRKIHKEYIALVSGLLADERMEIKAPVIRKDRPQKVREEPKLGKTTIYRIGVSRKFESESLLFTLLKVIITTGRTHQIRSHLSQVGLPIVGDRLYGNKVVNRWASVNLSLKRQFLHSCEIRFEYERGSYSITADPTEDLTRALNILEIKFPL